MISSESNKQILKIVSLLSIFLLFFSGAAGGIPLQPQFAADNPLIILKNDGSPTNVPTHFYFGYNNTNISMQVNMTEPGLNVSANFSSLGGATEVNFTDEGAGVYKLINYTLPATSVQGGAVIIRAISPYGINVSDGSTGPEPFSIAMNINPKDFPGMGANTTDWTTIEDFTDATVSFEGINGTESGLLEFLEPINLADPNIQTALMNLGEYMDAAGSEMSLNTTVLTAFNVKTRLTMYGLNFDSQPGILMNGVPELTSGNTTEGNVTDLNWDALNGTLVFNVDHWTTYTADGISPSVFPVAPLGDIVNVGETFNINVTAYDLGGAGMNRVVVDLSGINTTLGTEVELLNSGDIWYLNDVLVDGPDTMRGNYEIPINAYDNLGNVNNTLNLVINVPSRTLHVGIDQEYDTIMGAIFDAVDGDTVYVHTGTPYYEYMTIDKPLNLTGEGAGNSIIDGDCGGDTITIDADNVNINGFTITGGLDNNIYINPFTNINISNNDISGAPCGTSTGIYVDGNIEGSGFHNIKNNNIHDHNLYGIYMSYSGENTLTSNTINGNGEYGIYLDYSNYNNLTRNTVDSNYDSGIYLYYSDNNNLNNNIASSNDYGIVLDSSNENTLYENIMNGNNYANAIDENGNNNWNSSGLGNYYDDIYQKYTLTKVPFAWINTSIEIANWSYSEDDGYSPKIPIGFNFTLDGVTYADMQIVSNGVIQLIPNGGSELDDSNYASQIYWQKNYPDETFIFALSDDLYSGTGYGDWYGYRTYRAGDMDSGGNLILENLTTIEYHTSTYSDGDFGSYPNDYQVVLYENGTLRLNYKNLNYSNFDFNLYSGLYFGNSSSIHSKETIHVARAGQYTNETSYATPIIRTHSSAYDNDGNGIADVEYPIGDYGNGGGNGVDNYPLV